MTSSPPRAGPLRPLALARSGTDRAAERRGDDEWLAARWAAPATRVLRVGGGKTLALHDEPALLLDSPAEMPPGEHYLLGVDDDGTAFFANHEPQAPEPPPGSAARQVGLREVGAQLDDRDAGLLVLAVGLANWHDTHTHCPRCGEPTVVVTAGFVRRCPADGSEHYPRTDPAVIVLVADADGGRCLLGSSGRWPGRRFSTLAGFVEPGESAEAAVVREVREEAGVVVDDITYLGSQPWPFPSSLMLGFTARVADRDAHAVADGVELAEVAWFDRETIASELADGSLALPPAVSIARRLIEHWYGGELPASAPW